MIRKKKRDFNKHVTLSQKDHDVLTQIRVKVENLGELLQSIDEKVEDKSKEHKADVESIYADMNKIREQITLNRIDMGKFIGFAVGASALVTLMIQLVLKSL